MASPPPDPREPRVTETSIQNAKRAAAKEAIEALCVNFPEGFQVLLHRDRLIDRFGTLVLDEAFNDLLAERRLR